MNRADAVRYACHAARLALPSYEAAYPEDKRPRLAVDAAERGDGCLAAIAYDAYESACEAADDADYDRTYDRAAYAARSADYAAYAAAAERATSAAVYAACASAYSDESLWPAILRYGVEILEKESK
jgi:hypothetical protein